MRTAIWLPAVLLCCFIGPESRAQEVIPPEAVTLTEAVRAARGKLPRDQRAMVTQGVEFVVDTDEPETTITFGSVNPEHPSQIKITKRTIEMLGLLGKVPKPVARTIQSFFRRVLVHELEHSKQYSRRRLPYLIDQEHCPRGLCNEQLLLGTKERHDCELAALWRDFREVRSREKRQSYLDAAKFLERHPELLTPRIKDLPGRFVEAAEETQEPVVRDQLTFYDAMYDLPVLARKYLLHHDQAAKAKIMRYWRYNCGENATREMNILLNSYLYTAPIFAATLGATACRS